ncbi:MAG: hypothetical protein KJ947_22045 [Alphaproteobacteria bacterium]|nr:hypothetical protein [Alphaproteobacteria bacterium]MBU1552229.1 hypothetical protein [Alphaproteobacteria bacterium]
MDRFLSRPVQGAHRLRVALGYYHAVGEKFTERRGVCLRILQSPERSPALQARSNLHPPN